MKIILQREGRLNLLVSLFLLSMTDPLHAQWVQTNGPYAGTVTCFAVSGTNIFADTERGVWKTELGSEAIHVTMLSKILSIISRIWWLVLKVASFFGIVLLIIVMAYTIIAGVVLLIVLIISAIYEVAITPIYEVITGKERTARYEYWVYERETGEIRAVKRGWSWPAFFFSWIWAFTKGLIAIGVGVMLSPIILGGIFSNIDTELASYVIIIATLVSDFWLGAKGNKFVEDNLTKKGFKFAGAVNAATAEGAVASFLSNHSEKDRERF